MSLMKSALIGGGVILAVAAAAVAQDVGSWDLKERSVYAVDMNGKLRVYPLTEKAVKLMGTHAKTVPNGTVYFLHNGEFHHAEGAGVLFDKAGNWMGGR